jgi:hypothetical protein
LLNFLSVSIVSVSLERLKLAADGKGRRSRLGFGGGFHLGIKRRGKWLRVT